MRYPVIEMRQRTARQHDLLLKLAEAPTDRQTALSRALALSPELTDHTDRLLKACQNDIELAAPLRALAALTVAAVSGRNSASYVAATPFVVNSGLDAVVIAALIDGQSPDGLDDDQAGVHRFCRELRKGGSTSAGAHDAVAARFGSEACLELVILTGCVRYLGMLIEVTQV